MCVCSELQSAHKPVFNKNLLAFPFSGDIGKDAERTRAESFANITPGVLTANQSRTNNVKLQISFVTNVNKDY